MKFWEEQAERFGIESEAITAKFVYKSGVVVTMEFQSLDSFMEWVNDGREEGEDETESESETLRATQASDEQQEPAQVQNPGWQNP